MKTFEIENKNYEILIASCDNGLGCELWDIDKNKLLIEIFRNDNLKKVEFYSAEMNIPFDVVEKLLTIFEERVGREFQKN